MLIRAARGTASPALLGAPEARYDLPERTFAETPVVFATRTTSRAAPTSIRESGRTRTAAMGRKATTHPSVFHASRVARSAMDR